MAKNHKKAHNFVIAPPFAPSDKLDELGTSIFILEQSILLNLIETILIFLEKVRESGFIVLQPSKTLEVDEYSIIIPCL